MKNRHLKRKVKSTAPRPTKIDPTRTGTIRKAFYRDLKARYAKLRLAIQQLVVERDIFGLRKRQGILSVTGIPTTNQVRNTDFAFETNPNKVKRFRAWLRQRMDSDLAGDDLIDKYISLGFAKGVTRSFSDVKQATKGKATNLPPGFIQGEAAGFNRGVLTDVATVDKVKLLAGRTFSELEDVNVRMATKMSRILADGLVRGKSPEEIAEELDNEVDLGAGRALIIVNTELVRAHAEGQLTAMEKLGVETVGAAVEWDVAGDSKVCKMCKPLDGVVFSLQEAYGLLPRHPNCRCAWLPATMKKDLKKSKSVIDKAIARSVKAGKGTSWYGEELEVEKKRPEILAANADDRVWRGKPSPELLTFSSLLRNVFCPTGKGGGVDPHCSPDDVRTESLRSSAHADRSKAKFVGAKVGKKEHVHAASIETYTAKELGGEYLEDNEPLDVRVRRKGIEHAIEVKSLLKGKKTSISVHPDALLRKVEYNLSNPNSIFHTVVYDDRDAYSEGEHSSNYSGHRIYYKRGSGRYSLSKMYKVKSVAELKRLISMSNEELPPEAMGRLPQGTEVAKLRADAEKAHAARLKKDRERKARLKNLKKEGAWETIGGG